MIIATQLYIKNQEGNRDLDFRIQVKTLSMEKKKKKKKESK